MPTRFAAIALLSSLACLTPTVVSAADQAKPSEAAPAMPEEWAIVQELTEGQIGGEELLVLDKVAYHLAREAVCDDMSVDKKALVEDFDSISNAVVGQLTPAEANYYQRHVLVNFGMRVGILIANGVEDRETFCAPPPTDAAD